MFFSLSSFAQNKRTATAHFINAATGLSFGMRTGVIGKIDETKHEIDCAQRP
jgi:hypothetical protein